MALAGAVAALPLTVHAQQPKLRRLGFLFLSSAGDFRIGAFLQGLRDYGYVDGGNVAIEYRFCDGDYGKLAAFAAELVDLKVDVIVTHSRGASAARAATAKIPIVFAINSDSVAQGLIASHSRPGGNVTGSEFFDSEMMAKRLELLKELSPPLTRVAALWNPDSLAPVYPEMTAAARLLGIELTAFYARGPGDLERAFGDMAGQNMKAVVIRVEPALLAASREIAAWALRYGLLSIAQAELGEAGGLMGYGANIPALYRRVGYFVDRILKGADPGDLPVERPTKFDLVVNLSTAKALGVEIPGSILAQADTVIE